MNWSVSAGKAVHFWADFCHVARKVRCAAYAVAALFLRLHDSLGSDRQNQP
jgi:hypothetical protein